MNEIVEQESTDNSKDDVIENTEDTEDIGNIDINDVEDGIDISDKSVTTTSEDNSKVNNEREIEILKNQIKELNDDKQIRENELAINNAIKELSEKHKGFDSNKVKDYLVELNINNPKKANMLNNPVGWENIWLNEFSSKEVNNDNPSYGRNVALVDRSEEVLEKVNNGEWLSVEDELEVYGKHL